MKIKPTKTTTTLIRKIRHRSANEHENFCCLHLDLIMHCAFLVYEVSDKQETSMPELQISCSFPSSCVGLELPMRM